MGFVDGGLDLKSRAAAVFIYPTVLIFASAHLQLYVEQYKNPDLYALADNPSAVVELGPFVDGGLDLIETELQEAPPQPMSLALRQQVHLFYKTDGGKSESDDGTVPEV